VGGATGFQDDGRRWMLRHELEECLSLDATSPVRLRRRDHVKLGLCQINGNERIVLHDGLLHWFSHQRLWHSDADEVEEESISSDAADEAHGGWKDSKVAYLHLKSASQAS
jgi:hypothetical protein